jgi:hypothetical protein
MFGMSLLLYIYIVRRNECTFISLVLFSFEEKKEMRIYETGISAKRSDILRGLFTLILVFENFRFYSTERE